MAAIKVYIGKKGKGRNKVLVGLACLLSVKMKQPIHMRYLEHMPAERVSVK